MPPVRAAEHAFALGTQAIAIAVERHHRMLAAMKRIDVVVAIDTHGGDVTERPLRRPLGPALNRSIGDSPLPKIAPMPIIRIS